MVVSGGRNNYSNNTDSVEFWDRNTDKVSLSLSLSSYNLVISVDQPAESLPRSEVSLHDHN